MFFFFLSGVATRAVFSFRFPLVGRCWQTFFFVTNGMAFFKLRFLVWSICYCQYLPVGKSILSWWWCHHLLLSHLLSLGVGVTLLVNQHGNDQVTYNHPVSMRTNPCQMGSILYIFYCYFYLYIWVYISHRENGGGPLNNQPYMHFI